MVVMIMIRETPWTHGVACPECGPNNGASVRLLVGGRLMVGEWLEQNNSAKPWLV